MCFSNTFLDHKSFHKYNRVVGRDYFGVKSMIYLVLEKEMPKYAMDVRSVKELGMGISDNCFV